MKNAKTRNLRLFEIRIMYDGHYKILNVMATDEENAKEKMFTVLNQAHDYEIFSVSLKKPKGTLPIMLGLTPDSTDVQIENWNNKYSFIPANSTIGFYPRAKRGVYKEVLQRCYPEKGKTFRAALQFENEEDTQKAFWNLVWGEKTFLDYMDKYEDNVISKEDFLYAMTTE